MKHYTHILIQKWRLQDDVEDNDNGGEQKRVLSFEPALMVALGEVWLHTCKANKLERIFHLYQLCDKHLNWKIVGRSAKA